MVDFNNPPSPKVGEGPSKIKTLMGRTPGILKSKFLTVLGNSNEIINGIQNKLNLSSSSSEFFDDDEEQPQYDETIDYTKIDFESRRVKCRRAHEEIISGRFRHPNLTPKSRQDNFSLDVQSIGLVASSSSSSKSSPPCSKSIEYQSTDRSIGSDIEDDLKDVNDILNNTPTIDIVPPDVEEKNISRVDTQIAGVLSPQALMPKKNSNSSTLTSLYDPMLSASLESSDIKNWIRSDSVNSCPSWASSITLDSQTEESVRDFMKQFVEILFTNSSAIGPELKSEFGQMARMETGRLWFSRLVQAQRAKSKRVDETTFYSLVQHFAIVLFECSDSDDFSPAKSLMNMCFTFYHEIEVPGCEPYREYLFTYLRQQPIWHTLRFWNAAFYDALQAQRMHRPVPKNKNKRIPKIDKNSLPQSENDESDSANSSTHNMNDDECDIVVNEELKEDAKFQQNIAFATLGTFTFNMHAFGLTKQLCLEFLKNQSTISSLEKDQIKLLRDNINRMYHETEQWGAKET